MLDLEFVNLMTKLNKVYKEGTFDSPGLPPGGEAGGFKFCIRSTPLQV